MENKFNVFVERLRKIGIETTYFGNYPWIYLDSINGIKVVEKFQAEHGFTVAFRNKDIEFTDISEIFNLLRKYCKNGKS